ncbi:hypothetical protein HZU73_07366 [Apis mellifera caucasica]|nr:hypothetical protein HZU73_07366 [Apis mellifera caucasica]
MEQYKFCSSNVQDDTVPQENCFGGQKCSGFGKCSPVNTDVKEEGDDFLQKQGNFVRMENKNELDVPCRFFSDKNSRSNILSKSLTTLSEELSQKSKNTAKGASGDKISKSVRTSSKRRLILVSPFEKESEAKLTRSTDLEEFYCITRANKNIFGYYNNSKIGQIGGGDENITIIQSPRTEGINHLEISRKKCIANFLILFFY